MSTRNILCTYNGKDTAISSLRYAIKIAKHHDGWLTGVVRHGRPVLETRFGGQIPREVIKTIHDIDIARIKEVSDSFTRETTASDFAERSEFVEINDEEDLALGKFARSYDLIVTGIPENEVSATHLAAHPDIIALHSGRPILIVPDGYEKEGLAENAVVAWDGKRSAARALGDAMPILEEKAKVTVLCVGKSAPDGTDQLIKNLERHGIDANLIIRPRDHSVGHTILSATREVGAQLIVMGAYEHSKFSHDFFGGATTDVIAGTNVPVFMSH
ncbi:universal stress protein [Ruegeria sp. SCP11]|uniref:universal stress protein n=1 Tax=Ruegeria sp. SCP11 TaxID=3141378 RepID=UPI003338AB9F